MSAAGIAARVRARLASQAPRLEEIAVRANWRFRNRARSFDPGSVADPGQRALAASLSREGFAVTSWDALVGESGLFDEAAARARQLYEARRTPSGARAGSKETYLAKLATRRYDAGDPFVRFAIHPCVLNVVNSYLRLRSTLRALELWHTWPSGGDAIQTQLWHRDADDVLNVKVFCYFTEVRRPAGPLTYAPRTHPFGTVRARPERDAHGRSTDEQLARVVPESGWAVLEGPPGTLVFADTCGYHKQLKPQAEERVTLVAQYVSSTPYVARELELEGLDPAALTEDQHYAAVGSPHA